MQTRSGSASSVTQTTAKRSHTEEETEILMQRLNAKEKQLKEQSEALEAKQEYLTKMQEDMEQKQNTGLQEGPNMEQLLTSMNTIANQIERFQSRIVNLENASREGKETPREVPVYSQQLSQQVDPYDLPSPIRLKDAIDTVPKFDGHKMSVFHFCKICERALALIPEYHEYHLVQLIINKLQGHAYAAVEGTEYRSVFALTKRLKLIFGPNKSVDQYRGELANIYMKYNENIFDYISRVQELRAAILDGETDFAGNISDRKRDAIESNTLNSFINGLPSDLLVRVKIERPSTFEECISIAIQLSKTIEAENVRKRINMRPNFQPRADFNQRNLPNNTNNVNKPNNFNNNNNNRFNNGQVTSQPPFSTTPIRNIPFDQPQGEYATKICRYCKTPGHLIQECRKLAWRRSQEAAQQLGNSGNARSVPIATGVRRNEQSQGRPTYSLPEKTATVHPETAMQASGSAN